MQLGLNCTRIMGVNGLHQGSHMIDFARKMNTHFQKSILTQEGLSSNLKASSTALLLDKSPALGP